MTIRYGEFWEALQARLVSSAHLSRILGGAGRVYVPSDNTDQELADEGGPETPWGRIILLARTTLWPQSDIPGGFKNVAFLVSVQFNDFRAPGYDVTVGIDAAHDEVYGLLDDFVPALASATVAVPVWRTGTPPPAPFYDASRSLWITNAEYRSQLVPT